MSDFLKVGGHYAVVGLGASGRSALEYLHQRGYQVSVTDEATPDIKLPPKVVGYFGGLDEAMLASVDGIVISPGVNPEHPAIKNAKQKGIAVVSDVQLAIDECHNRAIDIVAITGSNAKSTVTTLVGEMAQAAGLAVGVGGNLGVPALELLKEDIKLCVLELSSFQLEHISQLNAKVATLLNLSPDHLDRHQTMQAYLSAKLKVFDGAACAVLPAEDDSLFWACLDYIHQHAKDAKITKVKKTIQSPTDFGLLKDDEHLYLAQGTTPWLMGDTLLIKGIHNLINALFALAIGEALGLPRAVMIQTLKAFKGLMHRCQFVARVADKDYFNDSKGTNIGSTQAAIIGLGEMYGEHSLALILGGVGKGQDFSELSPLIAQYCDCVLTIGQDADVIEQALNKSAISIIACQTLDKAVKEASKGSAKAVLLSPACASFDQYKNYNERGEHFVQLVRQTQQAN